MGDGVWQVPKSVHVTRETQEGTAAGIYGVIVSSAVMSSSHGETGLAVEITVLVTLVIYWGAERYARIVAERIHEGHRLSRTAVRQQLTSGWEMVSASALPLIVLAVMSLLGADVSTAVLGALVCSTVLLCVAGWAMGRGGRLSTRERVVSAAVAGMFGVVFIVLKMQLH
jgi:hypothetical protein